MIRKIVSGGQTGADQAALDVAIEAGVSHGGWIPRGRMTEAGPLPDKYRLNEMPTSSYPERTERNVLDSDGTLIISHGNLTGGSDFTRKMAEKHGKPCLHLDAGSLSIHASVNLIRTWIIRHRVRVLNVAGPRLSEDGAIYSSTRAILKACLEAFNDKDHGESGREVYPAKSFQR